MNKIYLHHLYTIAKNGTSLQEFTPQKRFSAKVLQLLPNGRALVRMNGIDIELSSTIKLKEQQRLVLEVVENRADQLVFKRVDPKIDKTPNIQKELIRSLHGAQLDLTLYTIWREIQEDLRLKKILASLGLDPQNLDGAALKAFFESLTNISTMRIENLDSDGKLGEFALLLQLSWLMQTLSGGIHSFLPLDWQKLQESGIYIKKIKEQEAYFCRVRLRFADIERIDFTLILHKRYLTVYLYIEDETFRSNVEQSVHELKERLSGGKVAVTIAVKEYNVVDIERLLDSENIFKRWA